MKVYPLNRENKKVVKTMKKGQKKAKNNVVNRNVSQSAITDADKALAILRAIHDIAHNSEGDGLTITKDWDLFTLTIYNNDGSHVHLGQMNREEDGFPILINEMYNYFCLNKYKVARTSQSTGKKGNETQRYRIGA